MPIHDKVLVYDYNATGHCPGWLSLVVRGLAPSVGAVEVACRSDAPQMAPHLETFSQLGAKVHPIALKQSKPHAVVASEIAKRIGAQHVFFPNFDSIIYHLGANPQRTGLTGMRVGGIWLRPTSSSTIPAAWARIGARLMPGPSGKALRRHQRRILQNERGIRQLTEDLNPGDLTLFFTDQAELRQSANRLGQNHLNTICDPWLIPVDPDRRTARRLLGIPDDRIVLLHLGTSRPEKGLADACEAIESLPDALRRRVLLYRAGQVETADHQRIERLTTVGDALLDDRYLTDAEVARAYAAADWVLLPYRFQRESSGILVHAAAHDRPVIVSDYGLIGAWTKQYRLGETFAHGSVPALVRAICDATQHTDWPRGGLRQFSESHSPREFQRTIVTRWLQSDRQQPLPIAG
jgi:glycosyltransferase involved in cell wall biosynthesis